MSSTTMILGETEGRVKQLSIKVASDRPRVLNIKDPLKKFKLGQSREMAMADHLKKRHELYLQENYPNKFYAKHTCGIVHILDESPANNPDIECICEHQDKWPKDHRGRVAQLRICKLGHYWFDNSLDLKKKCSECNDILNYQSKEENKEQVQRRKDFYEDWGFDLKDKNRRKKKEFFERKIEYDIQAKAIVDKLNESKKEDNKELLDRIDKLEKQITKLMEDKKK